MKKIGLMLLTLLTLAGGVGFAVTHLGGTPSAPATARGEGPMPGASTMPFPQPGKVNPGGPVVGLSTNTTSEGAGVGAPSAAGGYASSSAASSLGSVGQLPALGPKIVKTADLSLVVGKSESAFTTAWDKAQMVAEQFGGYVVSSTTEGVRSKTGSMLVRIPSSKFDPALQQLRGLGTIDRQSINGQDVTSQFIDLNARLKTWQAQESVLMRLMNGANSISETMNVQNQLQEVQFRIEQIQGELRQLRTETSYGSIQLSMRMEGVVVGPRPQTKPSIAQAWTKAISGFLGVLYVVVVGLGYLIPVALLAGIAVLGVRRLRPRVVA